jgi:Predicted drug exporters of the RND superfamily
VVTAAALIMVAVFASFLLGHDPAIMPIALALAVGVLVDAFAVRMTLVPAVMSLLGHRAWWLPRRLDKWLPDLDVEGAHMDENERAPAPVVYPVSPRQDVSS